MACMWAYQVASRPSPVLTLTSHGPDQDWSVSICTTPSCAARTGVPQAVEKSVPVWPRAQ